MARDLILGTTPRDWARETSPKMPTSLGRKLILGSMAAGTFAGLAFITRPWWSSTFTASPTRHDPTRQRMFLTSGTPSKRVTWSRH
jgi:hypothetical protein